MSHPILLLADCVAPAHNTPQGTICGGSFCMVGTPLDAPVLIDFFPPIFNILMEIFVGIRQIMGVLIDFFLRFSIF